MMICKLIVAAAAVVDVVAVVATVAVVALVVVVAVVIHCVEGYDCAVRSLEDVCRTCIFKKRTHSLVRRFKTLQNDALVFERCI